MKPLKPTEKEGGREVLFSKLEKTFNQLPVEEILAIANGIQTCLKTDATLVEMKQRKEYVTQADRDIQQYILNFFSGSELAGTYYIKAEEDLSAEQKIANTPEGKIWQLLIDPLDGTSAFCKDQETWGVMVGICDASGKLVYSWNLTSDGVVYQTKVGDEAKPATMSNLKSKIKNEKISIDVYDYGAGAAGKFPAQYASTLGCEPSQINVTSYPAAIWTGKKLYNGELDAMLWIPSSEGKKNYPDYDLIFLDALADRGLKIRLGKNKETDVVEMVVVAPTDKDADNLYAAGLTMIPPEKAKLIASTNQLLITNAL